MLDTGRIRVRGRSCTRQRGSRHSSNGVEKPCVRETLAEIVQGKDELEPRDATRGFFFMFNCRVSDATL